MLIYVLTQGLCVCIGGGGGVHLLGFQILVH